MAARVASVRPPPHSHAPLIFFTAPSRLAFDRIWSLTSFPPFPSFLDVPSRPRGRHLRRAQL